MGRAAAAGTAAAGLLKFAAGCGVRAAGVAPVVCMVAASPALAMLAKRSVQCAVRRARRMCGDAVPSAPESPLLRAWMPGSSTPEPSTQQQSTALSATVGPSNVGPTTTVALASSNLKGMQF